MTVGIPKRLSVRIIERTNNIIHALAYDTDDADMPMWVTHCGLGPLTASLVHVDDLVPNCMSCIAGWEAGWEASR